MTVSFIWQQIYRFSLVLYGVIISSRESWSPGLWPKNLLCYKLFEEYYSFTRLHLFALVHKRHMCNVYNISVAMLVFCFTKKYADIVDLEWSKHVYHRFLSCCTFFTPSFCKIFWVTAICFVWRSMALGYDQVSRFLLRSTTLMSDTAERVKERNKRVTSTW